jgi:hypothetical protein
MIGYSTWREAPAAAASSHFDEMRVSKLRLDSCYIYHFYQDLFFLPLPCVAAGVGVGWESRDFRFPLADEGGSMSSAPFSMASMRRQQSAATRELKRTSTWALRISRRRMNAAWDCSSAV